VTRQQVSRPAGGHLNQEVTNAVMRCHKRFLGRGPTKAQAFFRHNFVIVVVEESLSEAERRLVAGDQRDAVLQMRRRYTEAMRGELVEAVEALTERRVQAFLTANHAGPDLTAELFVLDAPVAGEPTDSEPG
jgi:uncharacterized protein YbcI